MIIVKITFHRICLLISIHELVEDGVEDERAPADEESGRDAAQEYMGSTPALVDLGVLAWRPRMIINRDIGILVSISSSIYKQLF